MTAGQNSTSRNVDIFRDTFVRYLGYANEVGESFRPLIHVGFVRFSYVVSGGYVLADSVDKMLKANQKYHHSAHHLHENQNAKVWKAGFDSLVWQSFASVIIPGFTINRMVKASSISVHRMFKQQLLRKSLPTAIGLCSVPFVIHPIDTFVHFAMNQTIRPWLQIKPMH
mmetsp:Transcript_58266/g.96598  ORF Transcript_58266/g.96598 Transcript_58266/m.96598 type:complete len:169 (+) Transcript_58266:32-538(+)